MKGRSLTFLALPALVAGIILIITFRQISSSGVIVTGGILFIVAGVLNMMLFTGKREHGKRNAIALVFSRVTSTAAVILGLSMLVFTETFTAMVPFIFGILIAMSALTQLYIALVGHRLGVLNIWWALAAAVLAGASAYLFMQQPTESGDPAIMLVTGASLAFFGLTAVAEGIAAAAAGRRGTECAAPAASPAEPTPEPRALDNASDSKPA